MKTKSKPWRQRPAQNQKCGADAALGRAGELEEVAPSYVFFACEDSSTMTGQVLHPNGGGIING